MPASRSRNERWREMLRQIHDRGGSLEFSVAGDGAGGPDLVWRVRLLALGEHEIVVEQPAAAGRALPIQEGVPLAGAMVVGQNRWVFRTKTLPRRSDLAFGGGRVAVMRVAMPDSVERVSRREHARVPTAGPRLPAVDCWPLLSHASAAVAEAANRARAAGGDGPTDIELELPEVGPRFGASLLNIGGGGMGLIVDKSEASGADRSRTLWLRVDLRPAVAPLGMVAKVVHTHLESTQNVYMGVAFEFGHGAEHREFVCGQIEKYVNKLQLRTRAAA
ncbi:MAG TPA: hypothetical protein VD971_10135 [Phycisphaerales bacterium]|nr:hypothetical protein [Phycisphaerales bacterium]